MRTQNRPTVRVTFALDNRRLVLLIAAATLVLTGVFALGVSFGAKVAAPGGGSAELPPLAALEEREARYLKAQELLAQAAPAGTPEAEHFDPDLPKPDSGMAAVEPDAGLDRADRGPVAAEPPPVEPPKAEPPKTEAPKTEPPKAEPPKPKAPEPPPARAEAPTPPPAAPPAADAEASTPAPPGRAYAIQVSSSPDRHKAESWVKSYKPFDSRKPYITEGYVEGKGTWYRIKIGSFQTREQAAAYQAIFEARTRVTGTILTLD